MSQVELVDVKIEKMFKDVIIPEYKFADDSGMDIRAYFSEEWQNNNKFCFKDQGIPTVDLRPLQRLLVPTGIKVAIPRGYEIQVRPRSGLALKKGITVLNTPGTIDAGYRNEIGIILYNSNAITDPRDHFYICHGDRIAQIVLQKVPQIKWQIVNNLEDSDRGTGGFGSTGIN